MGELIDSPTQTLTLRAHKGASILAHRGTAAQAAGVLELLAPDVPREPNHTRQTDDDHALACVEIAMRHPTLAVEALTRLFDLADGDAYKALQLSVDSRVLGLLTGRYPKGAPALPQLSAIDHERLRSRAGELAIKGHFLIDVLRHELAPTDPEVKANALRARDRILSRPEPDPNQTTFGSRMVTDAHLIRILDDDSLRECLDKLLCVAEDPREAAINRQDALNACRSLIVDGDSSLRSMAFKRSQDFVVGKRDGSAHDELAGPAHPLSAFKISIGMATLRGHGLQLAAVAAGDAAERRWVREQAVILLQAAEPALVNKAAAALASLPRTSIDELDADLLATHEHFSVRQLSAILTMRRPARYRNTALRLAGDKDSRVRRTLAEAVSSAQKAAPEDVRDVLLMLATDARHSVRTAAPYQA